MKDSVILYIQQYEAVKHLSLEDKGRLLDAIFQYVASGNTPSDLPPVVSMAFSFIRNAIDIDQKKHAQKCERNRKNANMRWQESQTNGCDRIQPYAMDADTDIDTDTDLLSKSSNEDITSSETNPTEVKINFKEIVEYFNKTTNGIFGFVRYPISEKRKGQIRARINCHGRSSFNLMIEKACKSDFLKGYKTDFKATFDWLIGPNNFSKVIEGNYDNRVDKLKTTANETAKLNVIKAPAE